jgi:hypothetical protein
MRDAHPNRRGVVLSASPRIGERLRAPTGCEPGKSSILVRRAAAVLLLGLVTVGPAAAQAFDRDARPLALGQWSTPVAAAPREATLPANLVLPDVIRPLVTAMWRQSPTFRRQCMRLAEHPDIIVDVGLAVGIQDARAQSRVERHQTGRHAAVRIEWRRPALYVEYIAHELEHVLEQLDGADLPRLARQGVDGVSKLGGVYETTRARTVGRTVASEVMQ